MNNDFYLLIAGSRDFSDYDLLKKKCDYLLSNQNEKEIHIVSGGARGADTLAARYAREKNYKFHVFLPEWDIYGKSAGFRRNVAMHQYIHQFENRGCICFWNGTSKGTAHNFKLCETYNTPLRIIRV